MISSGSNLVLGNQFNYRNYFKLVKYYNHSNFKSLIKISTTNN